MAKRRGKMDVVFPEGGEGRFQDYAQRERPFTSIKTKNVRNRGPLELRGRGGTRPGLTKYVTNDFGTNIVGLGGIDYIDTSGDKQFDFVVIADGIMSTVRGAAITTTTAFLIKEDGDFLLAENDDFLRFSSTVAAVNPLGDSNAFQMAQHKGKMYIADASVGVYNPNTGAVGTLPNAPTGQPIIGFHQDRMVLTGANHEFYISRRNDFSDWDFVGKWKNTGKALGGTLGDRGIIGGDITSALFWEDKVIVLATTDDLWVLRGNPAGNGEKRNLSHNVGIISPNAAVIMPNGLMIFLSRDGLYTCNITSNADPEPFSKYMIPQDLRDVDVTTNDIYMVYDHKNHGVNLFITPNAGDGEHWWIDLDKNALFANAYPTTMQPLVSAQINMDGYSDVILGCKDGQLRRHDNTASTDDGTNIASELAFGPFHISSSYGMDGMITEMISDFADNSTDLTWRIITADTAEEVSDAAEAAFAGGWVATGIQSGTWEENHNRPKYPRSSGAWAVLWISGTGKWSYESITLFRRQLGRLR